MPTPSAASDTVDILVASGGTTSAWTAIGNPTELGLIIPTITSSTVKVQVALDSSGTGGSDVYDGTGTQTLTFAAGTGAFAVGSNHMGACLAFSHLRIVCGSTQGADRTFKLVRKVAGIDPSV